MRVLLSHSPPWEPHRRGGLQNLTLSESGTEISEPHAGWGGMLGGSLPCASLPAGGSAHPSAAPRDGAGARLSRDVLAPEEEKGEEVSPTTTKGQATGQCAWWGFVI